MNDFPRRSKRSDSLRKRGWDGETSIRDAAASQKESREDQTGGVGEERVTRSHANSARRGEEERNAEKFDKGAGEETRERSFSWERQGTNEQQQEEEEERQEGQETQEVPPFDAEGAVKKLTDTKEHFAELCRKYLASYKLQGVDVSFRLSSSTSQCSTDSPNTTYPQQEKTCEERNAAGRTASFSAAAARPPRPGHLASTNHQPPPECECRGMPPDADIERFASFSSASPPPSTNCQPPSECRRMPSNFDAFLASDVLQLDYHPSNELYREELSAVESRALLILDSFHRKEQQVEGDRGGGQSECEGTILCKAIASKCDALKLSQFQSYQFAFKAAAVAEIVRLKSEVVKMRMKPAELPRDDILGKGVFGMRTPDEFVKRLKLENESAAKELAQLRAEKTAKEESLAEIHGVKRNLERRMSSCTCNNILPGIKNGTPTRNVTAPCELMESSGNASRTDGVLEQQQRQQDAQNEMGSRLKAMGGCHASVSAEDESRLERICEASVEHEVVKLVAEKLEMVKADMGVFVKTLQIRIAGVAGKINNDESRVRPVRVGLVCLQYLIEKLLAKKAEIEASMVDKTSDNRLGLKLHFRS